MEIINLFIRFLKANDCYVKFKKYYLNEDIGKRYRNNLYLVGLSNANMSNKLLPNFLSFFYQDKTYNDRNAKVYNCKYYIEEAFDWESTDEGFEYWNHVSMSWGIIVENYIKYNYNLEFVIGNCNTR